MIYSLYNDDVIKITGEMYKEFPKVMVISTEVKQFSPSAYKRMLGIWRNLKIHLKKMRFEKIAGIMLNRKSEKFAATFCMEYKGFNITHNKKKYKVMEITLCQ